ncbi:MAG: ATP-dependent helicase HrpB [bacterium]
MSFNPLHHGALPIVLALPELRVALAARSSAVLQAPPGAGKTTIVPLALLHEPWLEGRRILMLEPRRIAARAAARRMASLLGETIGAAVGFRVRGESRVGPSTRIEVITEGVLTRMLLDDPSLDTVGLVIFDEFHERSLNADFGLALALQTQVLLRPELRLLVMSATLDGRAVATLLGDASIVSSVGRQYPVDVRYLPARSGARVEDNVAAAVRIALARDSGSILAFLPGAAEIRRCVAALQRGGVPEDVVLLPLFGDLPVAAQDAAMAPAAAGTRKVVVATSIAETSITIDGVQVVIDGGVSRVSRFSPRTGMSQLETVRVSRAAAAQRTGRAGRTGPGVSYRLWTPEEDTHLPDRARPEILEADLSSLALDLAVAGIVDPANLRWLDPPPAAALSHARSLLRDLGALDDRHAITAHGKAMAAFGLHPRLSHMLLTARDRGLGASACTLAALLGERDIFRRDAPRDVDLRSRVSIAAHSSTQPGPHVDGDALRRVREQSRTWRRQLDVADAEFADEAHTGELLALGYPDRVAQRRAGVGNHYLMRNGSGAVLDDFASLATASYLVIADLDGRSPHARIFLAAPLERAEVEDVFSADVTHDDVVEWDAAAGVVTAVHRERLGVIVLREVPLRDVDPDAVAHVIVRAIQRGDGLSLPWSEHATRMRDRTAFLRSLDATWPDFGEAALHASMEEWFTPYLTRIRRRADVEHVPLGDILRGMLTWEQQQQLDVLAPTHIVVPTGSRIAVDYSDPAAPVLAVRLQEMFGLADTPRIAGGRVPLTLHLLSPAHRPVQVTRDLAGFWRSSYFAVRKDLRGRYPRHEWPEDPMSATPTRRAKGR